MSKEKTSLSTSIPEIIGSDYLVNTLDGRCIKYLNLDNAATTPTFKLIQDKVTNFLQSYGSIHRGSGIKSQISTKIFEESIAVILDFLNVKLDDYALVVTPNTTGAINKLSRMLNLDDNDTVFLSEFEHSANDLPWRKGGKIVRIPADGTGQFDMGFFEEALSSCSCKGRKFVAVSGASNITGALTPIHEIAKLAHFYDALVMVDAAQLVAHREINLIGNAPGEHIDFICFAGHKMYAPFGGGVLIGRKDLLEQMTPDDIGGGNVDFVTNDSYDLAKSFSKRSAAGTQNAIGIISMGLSCRILKYRVGFEYIFGHERDLLERSSRVFESLSNISTYCDLDYDARKKCSILTFNIDRMHPNLVAARLGYEFGIGVRQGAICQYSYVAKLLGLNDVTVRGIREDALSGKMERMFGIVRASFGLENNREDVDRLAEALKEIEETPERADNYYLNSAGEFYPKKISEIRCSHFFDF